MFAENLLLKMATSILADNWQHKLVILSTKSRFHTSKLIDVLYGLRHIVIKCFLEFLFIPSKYDGWMC